MKNWWMAVFAAAALTGLAVGCDNTIPANNDSRIPGAYDDPSSIGGYESDMKFGAGAGEGSIAGNPNEWTAADQSGNRFGLPVIYFGYDTDTLAPSEQAKLDVVCAFMQEHGDLGMILEGHCDQRGTEEYNRGLGQRRADSIRNYLVSRGISDARLKTISFGKDKPLVDGSGESIWSRNRRGVPIPANMR